ncbi:MAG: trigger factor [Bifidobacteriaceae bacterium]|jgi:trigger factor|nr:trigger factor [Bifidobacteriaceae bacterium]
MKTSLKNNSETNLTITVSLNKNDMKSEIDAKYEELSKTAKIPGFRKGHIPKPIIDKKYGPSYAFSLAIEKIVSNAYFDALEKNNVKPLTEPKIDITKYPDLSKKDDDNLEFKATLEIRPEIDIPNLKDFEIVVDKVSASADDIMNKLEQMSKNYATLKAVDRAAKDGDFISLNLKASVNGKIADSSSGVSYQIGSDNMLPDLDKEARGMKAGEKKSYKAILDKGEQAGKKADIDIEILSVKEQELPKLDDSFAKLVSDFDTLSELKKDVKKEVLEDKKNVQVNEISNKFIKKLAEDINVNVPKAVIDDTAKAHIEDMKKRGQKLESADEKKVHDNVKENLKISFILDSLGEKLDVKISKEEFTNYVVNLSMRYNMPPEEFMKIMEQSGQMPGVLRELGQSKSVNEALKLIKVKDSAGEKIDISSFLVKNQGENK